MTSLLIGCGNLGKIILERFSKKKKILVIIKNRYNFDKFM